MSGGMLEMDGVARWGDVDETDSFTRFVKDMGEISPVLLSQIEGIEQGVEKPKRVGFSKFKIPLGCHGEYFRSLSLPFTQANKDDFEMLISDQHLIPSEWQRRVDGKIPTLCFLGYSKIEAGEEKIAGLRLEWKPEGGRVWLECWISINQNFDSSYSFVYRA